MKQQEKQKKITHHAHQGRSVGKTTTEKIAVKDNPKKEQKVWLRMVLDFADNKFFFKFGKLLYFSVRES
jgi:hypothetical protein